MREVGDELCTMAPESWKQEITEAIDLEILSQLLNSGDLDMDYLGKVMEFSLVSLQKLSAAANENKLKEAHQKVLQELAEICLAGDGSNHSHVVALSKGLRFVLEQILEDIHVIFDAIFIMGHLETVSLCFSTKILKQEISKARIRIMEPLLKGTAGLEYLGKAFAKSYGPPSDALTALPLTSQWLSSVWPNKDQEWSEHVRALSQLTNVQESSSSQRHLPSTTLRTGGNFSVKMSPATAMDAEEKQLPACKGEKVDLTVRLGLLKLVSGVSGLTQEELPETLNRNFVKLRTVQSQLQKITVIATSVLVLRQTLLIDQMMSNDSRKTESRKEVTARMLLKSVQSGDPIFTRVSHAIYLAAREVVLGGTKGRGRDLAEMALQQVGAAALTDRVVEAAKVLVVVANVTGRVHELWYAQLIGNMCS